jgi:hypothetical protein
LLSGNSGGREEKLGRVGESEEEKDTRKQGLSWGWHVEFGADTVNSA